jgi:Na+/H+ antiporter NhaD/arsenite permease-like protein
MRNLTIAAALLTSIGCSGPAAAWWDEGHMQIAAMAYDRLTPAVRAKVDALIKLNPQYSSWIGAYLGQPIAKVAILGGSLLLFTRRVKIDKVYREIDWPLLVMFIGLFIVVGGLEKTVLTSDVINAVSRLHLENVALLSAVTAGLSNLIGNVPTVLLLKPFIGSLQDPQRAWLTVAMASTLAGNLTLVGSVANLIVVQRARSHGVEIDFWAYLKVGATLTVSTLLFGILWI